MGCLVLFSTYKGFGTLSPRGNAFKADDSKGEAINYVSRNKGTYIEKGLYDFGEVYLTRDNV